MNAKVASEMLQSTSHQLGARSRDAAVMAGMVAGLLRTGLKTLETDREAAAEIIATACTVLETAAATDAWIDRGPAVAVPGGLMPGQIQRVRVHVEENLNGQLAVAELAELVGLGPSHFRRAFKRSLGISPHAFVVERRIKRAQELMLRTNQPLSEISLAVGFADQAHLTTRFHRIVGKTPGVWRRERSRGDNARNSPNASSGVEAFDMAADPPAQSAVG